MTIIVCPLHEVDEAIARWRPSHVVSLASPGAEVASVPEGLARLQLTFHDIAEPREGLRAVSTEDVDRLLAFGRGWRPTAPLLIQCWAGVSRSPAAAYVIACAFAGEGSEGRVASRLRAAAPFSTPNPLLVSLADETLGRGGRMTAAITEIGRGADTDLGRSFELSLL